MPLNLATPRAVITDTFQTKTLTITRDGLVSTSACGIVPRSGSTERGDGVDAERGEYRLTLPAGSTLVLNPGEVVRVDGRRYRVVWAPPRTALNLSDAYGASEVR